MPRDQDLVASTFQELQARARELRDRETAETDALAATRRELKQLDEAIEKLRPVVTRRR